MQDLTNTITETEHNNIISPMLTDNYQITMSYTYFCHNRHNSKAVFEAFFRKCPFGTKEDTGQHAIFGGLEEVIKFVKNFKFTQKDVDFLKFQMPDAQPEFFEYLLGLNCNDLSFSAFHEGSLVFPHEPLIRLEGPLALIQMLETPILNLLNFPTLVATCASRMKKEAGQDKRCLEFGLRRAQGPDGGLTASQYSYLGGFDGTSNVLAGQKFGIPVSGTMAHSFVTSYRSLDQVQDFQLNGVEIKQKALEYRKQLLSALATTQDGELAAFIAYARAFPSNFLCLVDTYNVLESGLLNFLFVAFALMDAGYSPKGVRLDSGDLAQQSIDGKALFQEYGQKSNHNISDLFIVASNDINEDSLKKLNAKGHQLDGFGIGTQLVTCAKCPALGMVYKLCELEGDPKHKLVQTEPSKSTLPGKKAVYRVWTDSQYPAFDLICQETEDIQPDQVLRAVEKSNPSIRYQIRPKKVQKQLVEYWHQGKLIRQLPDLQKSRQYSISQKQSFNPKILQNDKPSTYKILLSENYFKFFEECSEKIRVYSDKI